MVEAIRLLPKGVILNTSLKLAHPNDKDTLSMAAFCLRGSVLTSMHLDVDPSRKYPLYPPTVLKSLPRNLTGLTLENAMLDANTVWPERLRLRELCLVRGSFSAADISPMRTLARLELFGIRCEPIALSTMLGACSNTLVQLTIVGGLGEDAVQALKNSLSSFRRLSNLCFGPYTLFLPGDSLSLPTSLQQLTVWESNYPMHFGWSPKSVSNFEGLLGLLRDDRRNTSLHSLRVRGPDIPWMTQLAILKKVSAHAGIERLQISTYRSSVKEIATSRDLWVDMW